MHLFISMLDSEEILSGSVTEHCEPHFPQCIVYILSTAPFWAWSRRSHLRGFWGQSILWCICLALSVPHLLVFDLWESPPSRGGFLGECIRDGGISWSGDLQSLVVLAGDCFCTHYHYQPYIHTVGILLLQLQRAWKRSLMDAVNIFFISILLHL